MLGYGLTCKRKLPKTEISVLEIVLELWYNKNEIPIIWASQNYLFRESKKIEDQLKIAYLEKNYVLAKYIWPSKNGIKHTKEEVKAIVTALEEKGFDFEQAVIVVCDRCHRREVEKILKKFPKLKRKFQTVKGVWDKDHYLWYSRSQTRWLLSRILSYYFPWITELIAKMMRKTS